MEEFARGFCWQLRAKGTKVILRLDEEDEEGDKETQTEMERERERNTARIFAIKVGIMRKAKKDHRKRAVSIFVSNFGTLSRRFSSHFSYVT